MTFCMNTLLKYLVILRQIELKVFSGIMLIGILRRTELISDTSTLERVSCGELLPRKI